MDAAYVVSPDGKLPWELEESSTKVEGRATGDGWMVQSTLVNPWNSLGIYTIWPDESYFFFDVRRLYLFFFKRLIHSWYFFPEVYMSKSTKWHQIPKFHPCCCLEVLGDRHSTQNRTHFQWCDEIEPPTVSSCCIDMDMAAWPAWVVFFDSGHPSRDYVHI